MWMAIVLAVAAFAATNVDNLFVLLAFFAEARDAWRPVVVGQYIGSMALVVLAYVIASLMIHIPRAYVGLIGIMPILIGVGKLLELSRRANGSSGKGSEVREAQEAREVAMSSTAAVDQNGALARPRSSIWAVATVAIANGSDNLSVYVPLFAARSHADAAATAAVFVAMIGLWCSLAKWLVSHRLLGKPINRYAHWVLPWILMLIGVSVIVGNGTLRVFGL